MKVYILAIDEDEEYEIASIHSSMERALEEKYRKNKSEDYRIKEYELDPELSPVKEGFELGKVYHIRTRVPYETVKSKEELTKYRHPEACEVRSYSYTKGSALIEVFSPISYEHAEKVANEEKEKLLKGIEQ